MDALGDMLLPYKEPVAMVARIVTMGHMFSGSFLCYDIYKQGNTNGISSMTFLAGLIMNVLNLTFGFILRDNTMIQVNFFGLSMNIIYVVIFYQYSQHKGQFWRHLGITVAVIAAIIGYAEVEDPTLLENRLGTIITAFMFFMISSPLFRLKDIIRNKSTEGMPFPIILSAAIVTFMWLLYGIILKNKFLILQNIVAFGLCAFQLGVFVVYPSKPKGKEKSKAKAKKTN